MVHSILAIVAKLGVDGADVGRTCCRYEMLVQEMFGNMQPIGR